MKFAVLFLCSIGYACAQIGQWQYGKYPRYGYVYNYGGVNTLGFGYGSYNLEEPVVVSQPSMASYYQPGSFSNSRTRIASPTNRVVDYNQMRSQIKSPQTSTIQRQIPHPALQPQVRTNNYIQSKQKELQRIREHQQEMIRAIQKNYPQVSNSAPQISPKLPLYPSQGFVLKEKPKQLQRPMFQAGNPHFGSSYLPSGAGRVAELTGSLGDDKSTLKWVQARMTG